MSLVAPTDPTDVAGRLNYACQMGHTSFVETVVRECDVTNFDMLDHYGSPPLYNAAMKNDNPQLVEYLLRKGASLHVKNADNETAFFIAVFNNHIEVAKLLITKGAKVDEKGGVYGDFPLHCAVRNNLRTMVNLLLHHNANVNCRNDQNETPLYIACKLNRKEIAYTLLMNKANKALQSAEGKDPLFIASEKKNRDCVKLLKANGPADLMQVKQQFEKPQKTAAERKESWREVEFRNELKELGISEADAARRPRDLPKPAPELVVEKPKVKKERKGPLPLYDSDEDEETRMARLERQQRQSEAILSKLPRYHDPEGTSYNPSDPFHQGEMQKAKETWNSSVPYSQKVGPKSPPSMKYEDHTTEQNATARPPRPAAETTAAATAPASRGASRRTPSSSARNTTPSKSRSSSSTRKAAVPSVRASRAK